MLSSLGSIHFLPVIVGGIVYMLYGGIYYSVVLSNKNKDQDILSKESKGLGKYFYSVIVAFISSAFMGLLIQLVGADNVLAGVGIGFIIGLLISLVYLKNSLFGLMSKKSFLIAIGDHLIIFPLLGAIHIFFM